jgi:hypothetical protein
VTTSYDLPLPGDEYDGRTVIASTYCGPDDSTGLLILLNAEPPFYAVADVELHSRENMSEESFRNINQAVRDYANRGGDF